MNRPAQAQPISLSTSGNPARNDQQFARAARAAMQQFQPGARVASTSNAADCSQSNNRCRSAQKAIHPAVEFRAINVARGCGLDGFVLTGNGILRRDRGANCLLAAISRVLRLDRYTSAMQHSGFTATAIVLAGFLILGFASCSRSARTLEADAASTHTLDAPPAITVDMNEPVDLPGLHNVVAYAPDKYSGSVPEGEAGFETLKAMGVKTIISVDGAQPDVDAANALGLRYVHLPIGYNGMDEQRTLEIARAIRDLPGPVYLHCHHGKHRSAGALGAAVVTLGLSTPEDATQRMKVSGTAPNYTGLYQCVVVATIASAADLNAADNTFPQRWRTTGLVNSMVEVDEVYEYLKMIEEAGWKAPVDHPDLVPVAEAGRLADLFRNVHEDDVVKSKPMEMRDWLLVASRECEDLERGLAEGKVDAAELGAQFALISKSCKDCHARFRD